MLKNAPVLVLLLAITVANGFGAAIYGTAAPLGSGSRTEGTQIITGGTYATDDQTFTVTWDISLNPGTSTYSYAYTFSGFTAPDISHFIFDLTDNCADTANQSECIFNISSSGGTGSEFNTFGTHPSNPGFPSGSSITGVKFNVGSGSAPLTFSFVSLRAPMWGDLYFKGGSDSFAYNAGLENHTLESTNAFIPVVDTVGAPIPEPVSLLSIGSGLVILGRWLGVGRRAASNPDQVKAGRLSEGRPVFSHRTTCFDYTGDISCPLTTVRVRGSSPRASTESSSSNVP